MALGFSLVASLLLKAGRPSLAAYLLGFGVWTVVFLTAAFTQGVRAPVVMAFPLIILGVGWVVSSRAALLMVVMVVAIRSAFWSEIDSLEYLLGLSEMAYLAIFLWLALAGAGTVSLDSLLQRSARRLASTDARISQPAVQ